jgi:hypothetical protein
MSCFYEVKMQGSFTAKLCRSMERSDFAGSTAIRIKLVSSNFHFLANGSTH